MHTVSWQNLNFRWATVQQVQKWSIPCYIVNFVLKMECLGTLRKISYLWFTRKIDPAPIIYKIRDRNKQQKLQLPE